MRGHAGCSGAVTIECPDLFLRGRLGSHYLNSMNRLVRTRMAQGQAARCQVVWQGLRGLPGAPMPIYRVIGHNHAAPRTPLESPNFGGSNSVATWSENTYFSHCAGTSA